MAADPPNLIMKKPNSSIIPHLMLVFVQIVALASPPFTGRRVFSASIIVILATYCNIHPYFTNNFDLAQPFSLAWSFYLATLAKLLYSGPGDIEDHFWRLDKPAKEAREYAGFGWKKLRWASALIFNHRGIRWSHQVKNVPPLPEISRNRFMARQFVKAVACGSVADILYQVHQRVNFSALNRLPSEVNSKSLTLYHRDWRWSIVKTFSLALLPYFALSMQFALAGLFAVFCNISTPEDWPPPFGKPEKLVTVRSFWGAFWHQQLRHMLTSYTDAFTKFLRIPPGTILSSYTKLYLAFGLSGSFHALSQLHLPRPANITAAECSTGFLFFFFWQAVAITVEDVAVWAWRKIGFKTKKVRLVGYAWVFVTLWWTFPLVGDTVLKLRIGTGSFAPFTFAKPLVRALMPIPP